MWRGFLNFFYKVYAAVLYRTVAFKWFILGWTLKKRKEQSTYVVAYQKPQPLMGYLLRFK